MARFLAALLALLCMQSWAQSPVDAGKLLEQQRRLEQQQQQTPSTAPRNPLAPGAAASAPANAAGAAQVTLRQVVLRGNSLIADAPLQAPIQPWLMRPLTLPELRQAGAAVEQVYRDAGWLAHVSLPAQDLTDGRLRMEITEARMGRVQLAANTLPVKAAARVSEMLSTQLASGDVLNLDQLERALLLADEMPGVRVGGSLQASSTPGRTDLLVQVARSPLLQGDVSMDNAANRSTGSERVNALLRLDDALGFGDQLGLAASKTRGTSYLRASASLPVSLRGWRFGVNGSALRYHVLDRYNTTIGLAPKGSSNTFGAEASYPLVRSPRARWTANFGTEQKRQFDQDDTLTLGTWQATGRARSRSLHAGITGYAFDNLGRGGQTQASAQLTAGKLDLDGSPPARLLGDAATESTQGRYLLLRWSVSRVQQLAPDLAIAASASGQFASRNLNSNEKMYLGGMGGINAYPSGEAGGSTGQMLNLELRRQMGPRWQASALLDWGRVRQYQDNTRADGKGPLTADNTLTLKGAGLSVGWRNESGLRVTATYSHRIGSNPLATSTGRDSDGSPSKNRVWLSAGISF